MTSQPWAPGGPEDARGGRWLELWAQGGYGGQLPLARSQRQERSCGFTGGVVFRFTFYGIISLGAQSGGSCSCDRPGRPGTWRRKRWQESMLIPVRVRTGNSSVIVDSSGGTIYTGRVWGPPGEVLGPEGLRRGGATGTGRGGLLQRNSNPQRRVKPGRTLAFPCGEGAWE